MSRAPGIDVLSHARSKEFERHQRPLDWAIIVRLLKLTNPYAAQRNTLLVLVLIRSLQLPALAWAVSAVLNGPVLGQDMTGIVWGAAGFALLAVLTFATFRYRMLLALELGERVVHDLRAQIFDHLQRMSMSFYDRTKLGRIISRMTSDAEALRMGIQDVAFVSLLNSLQMVVAAAVMLYYDWPLFLVLLAMAPVLWAITRFFRKRLSTAWRNIQESFSRITATLAESVNGIRVTQGFVRQDRNAELFEDLVTDHSNHHLRAARLTGVFLPLLELNNQFFFAVVILLGGYQALLGGFYAGDDPQQQLAAVVVFFFMAPIFFGSIATIGRQYNIALTAMAGAERVFALLDTPPEQLDAGDATDIDTLTGRVSFENVGFAYEQDRPVLDGVSFVAEPGQTIALVGHTGSGKTTIIRLISKFYVPTAGRLLIDHRDITGITGESLRKQLGIVLQTNFLFTGSVMDNIRVGKPDATDAEVVEAVRKLDCLDLLEALPEGLDTQVGEGGTSLSLGQRQLVCFGRAMLADPRILILDEATSSVDTMTEARIQAALRVLLKDRTSFVVAHRLSTIRHADQVLVLDHGKIVERGTHMQLLEQAGTYANLYRQFVRSGDA